MSDRETPPTPPADNAPHAVRASAPPPGFRPLPGGQTDFGARALGLHVRVAAGALSSGFRVLPVHLNLGGICHGGAIGTFCDLHMALAVLHGSDIGTTLVPTVSLAVDYLDRAQPGEWLEATGELLRRTRQFAFAQTIVRADGRPVARANAVYRIGPGGAGGADTGAFLRTLDGA